MVVFRIRAIEHADRAQWEPLWQGYNAFYGRAGDAQLDAEIVSATWQRFFDDDEPVHALVAYDADQLLGITHFMYHRSMIRIEPVC